MHSLHNQCTYIESRFKVITAKPVATLMDPAVMVSKDQGPMSACQRLRMQHIPYAKAISSVLWLTMISRPDVAFAVGTLMQFIQNPGEAVGIQGEVLTLELNMEKYP